MLTDPASLAWTFNIRGHDVPHTPLALGFALDRGARAARRLHRRAQALGRGRTYLEKLARIVPPGALETELAARARSGAAVALDPALAAEKLRLMSRTTAASYVREPDPARLPRATKNRAELAGARAAHRRDGAAVTKFLAWLDRQPPGTVDEISVATKLEECRRDHRRGDAAAAARHRLRHDFGRGAPMARSSTIA